MCGEIINSIWEHNGSDSILYEYMEAQGYDPDITDQRLHHEIYLSDARKVAPEKLKSKLFITSTISNRLIVDKIKRGKT